MSKRTARAAKLAAKASMAELSEDSDDEQIDENDDGENSQDSQDSQDSQSRTRRLNADSEETFVKLVVEHFDDINSKETIRGIPTSKGLKQQQEDRKYAALEKIANEMNSISGVSFCLRNDICLSSTKF